MIVESDVGLNTEEDGENYFVSMTDMMVGVLFIFIIMLMTFALDFRRTTDVQEDALKVAQEVARKLDALQSDVKSQLARIEARSRDLRVLLEDIRDQLAAQGLNVQIDENGNGVLHLTEDAVRFAAKSPDLVDKNKDNVDKISRVLWRVLPKYVPCRAMGDKPVCGNLVGPAIETLFIEGHTDATGVDSDNWQLSTARAVNTYRELIAVSPSLRTLLNHGHEEIMSVSGYASTRPIDPRYVPEAWGRNRRIDLRFVMETDNSQKFLQILKVTDDMRGEIDRLRAASGTSQ